MAAEPPSPTKQEVSGTDMTLLDSIRRGEIEKPPLCDYSVENPGLNGGRQLVGAQSRQPMEQLPHKAWNLTYGARQSSKATVTIGKKSSKLRGNHRHKLLQKGQVMAR